jgi:uncharacterized protein DUF6985
MTYLRGRLAMAPRVRSKKRGLKTSRQKTTKRVQPPTSLPKLRWSEYEWKGETTLPAWRGFHTKFPPRSPVRSRKPADGKVKLTVSTNNDKKVSPSPEQINAFRFLVENQNEIRDIILKAILKAYPKSFASWLLEGGPVPEFLSHLPKKFSRIEELKSHICLANIYLLPSEKRGMAYVGYGFEATWDVEHGLGAAMHGKRLVEIGDEEVAFAGDAAKQESRAGKIPKKLNLEDIGDAAFENNLPWVKALLKAGADPEISPYGPGTSAIEHCVFADRLSVLRELLKYAKRPASRRAWSTAKRLGDKQVLKLLSQHDAKVRRK